MGQVTYGPALVSNMRGVCGNSILTWAPPRQIVGKRARGVRNRKVGRHSVPKLLARMDTIWRALPASGKFALRRKAAANNYTNYVWFRRHVLNHLRRTGYKGPLALDLDTAYYIPVIDAAYAGGDIIELRWIDPIMGPRVMDLRSVGGQEVVMVQDAIHCELITDVPLEYSWIHGWEPGMGPFPWNGIWTSINGTGNITLDAKDSHGGEWSVSHHVGPGGSAELIDIGLPPTMDWWWDWTPDFGSSESDSGTDTK